MSATARKPYRKAPPQHRETRPVHHQPAAPPSDVPQEPVSESERIRMLEAQNEELRRRLSLSNQRTEALGAELDSCRHYMEAELNRTRDDLDKMRDKFRRLQNSYTASQRTNQDLEEKLHALLRKVERDKKTMDQELVELTNKLLDAKGTIDRLEELNERYRQDCNLAVQLLKCNKSHFRNHKFADLPTELQDMLNKHMKNTLPDQSSTDKDPDSLSLTPADVVPTSVIARVLEKPEPLLLNSAHSRSSRPIAEDVFVHVDMTSLDAQPNGASPAAAGSPPSSRQQNGSSRPLASPRPLAASLEDVSVSKLNPYPAPPPPLQAPPPHALYPGRKVIEFSSDDRVKIPKNSPLPNCTYATRQAISLSLVESPTPSASHRASANQREMLSEPLSSQSSPFSSPPQALSAGPSSGSSEEDLLNSWQRLFVDKMAPSDTLHRTAFSSQSARELQHRGGAYSDGEEVSSNQSWTPSRGSSLDTDTDPETRPRPSQDLLDLKDPNPLSPGLLLDSSLMLGDSEMADRKCLHDDDDNDDEEEEERDVLPGDLPIISSRLLDPTQPISSQHPAPAPQRPPKSPKRMGVHHLHRKDSLTRAQEQGTLLD
ncbi:tight junction-associated protein 1 [Periophthalmus magnuspinnatus]|uniref:tight junction-associated protein 1 n=1 Tax=Periophthalmus magnuspinnatus TaxID=409849 RepID=UPI00145BFEE0|nr:tight junction-associated protein 1 [Periophthalmus magnuspinnatus]